MRQNTMTYAWVIPTPLCCTFLASKSPSRCCIGKVGGLRTAYRRQYSFPGCRLPLVMSSDDKNQKNQSSGDRNDSSDESEVSNDWDASWSEYSKRRSGGVFGLPSDDKSVNRNGGASQNSSIDSSVTDERTERLTSLWSSENGFLIGIGVILFVAMFYIYVYNTGGISH